MARFLVVVESPAKARTIQKYLGEDYAVRASMGHVRDLPPKALGVDIESGFTPTYETLASRAKVLQTIRSAAKSAEKVFLAPDPDREGEAIAWHVVQALRLPDDKVFRVTFNEITRRAVQRAFEAPGKIDMAKVDAQQARRVLDRIVGYQISPLLWKKVAKGLSAGRVQSVAVRLIVEREKEIRAFKPEEYWEIHARLAPAGNKDEAAQFDAELVEWQGEKFGQPKQAGARRWTGDEAHAIAESLRTACFAVISVERKQQKTEPGPPFNTSLLQQAASARLRFSATLTMRVAQQLYEGIELGSEGSVGLITYMRTDSFRVAADALSECREVIAQEFGREYLPPKERFYRSRKGAQEAHEAIRPTSVRRTPDQVRPFLSNDQFRLYELIWSRFVASQMSDALYNVTNVDIRAADGLFKAKGRVCTFDGHTRVWASRDDREPQNLPPLKEGQLLDLLRLEPSQHFTKPPARYTEASLVRTLESEGIGRPSTYATIISTIQERGYVRQEKRAFYATDLGIIVTDLLVASFPRIMDVQFTSAMEEKLDKIEEEHLDWATVLDEFYKVFKAHLDRAETEMKSVKGAAVEGGTCPKCGKPIVERWSKFGRFVGCSGYPGCRYVRPEPGVAAAPDTEAGPQVVCDLCGKPMALKNGRRGKFLGCTGYPECKNTKNIGHDGKPKPPPEPTDEVCEKCGASMVIRTGSHGRFLACSAFPKCRNVRNIPTGIRCPREGCDGELIYKRGRGRRKGFYGCTKYPDCDYTVNELPQQNT